MGSVRSRLWALVAMVAGSLLVVTGLAAPADAATRRAISVSATPTAAYAGATVTVKGKLTRSPKGTVVRIQRKAGKKWVAARNTRTVTKAGYYATKVAVPRVGGVYTFRAVALKTRKLRAATSRLIRVTALRRVAATIRTSPSTIELGDATEISGSVTPFVGGTTATVQRFDGVRWGTYFTVPISRTGTFKKSIHPIASSTYRVVVPRKGYFAAATSASTKLTISNGPVAPEITTTTLPNGRTETAYGQTLSKTGRPGTWTITAGALPNGLSFNGAAGTITGTPTATGDFAFTVTFSETDTALSDSQALSIHVDPIAKITTTALPNATAFAPYGPVTLTKSGLSGTWSVTGTLPTGITFDAPTATLSGKSTVSGDFPLTFTFTDTTGYQATKPLNLHVNVAPDPVITTTALPDATAFRTYSASVAKTGNAGTWEYDGTLPAGVSFNADTGALTGKPTVAGDYPLTFTFTETESGTSASKDLTLKVLAAPNPVISTTSLPNATAFQAGYTTTLAVTSSALPGTWSSTGTLPTGITFDGATGTLSGKPTQAGDFALTFTYTETESGKSGSKALTLKVNPAPNPVISTTNLPNGVKDQPYVAGTKVEVSTPRAGTWTVTGGALPAGILLNADTGALTGTPTVAGSFPVTFTFTETESGTFASKQLTITVLDRPVITTASLPDATRGSAYSQTLVKTGGSGTGTWAVTAGTLPAGLTLTASTGKISGTPTTLTNAANEEFTVRFTDTVTGLQSTPKVLAIHVAMAGAPTFNTPPSLPDATVGVEYSKTLSASGGLLSRWSLESGSAPLPPGLSINAITGEISGTPTTAGTYKFVVRFGTTVPLTYNTRQYTIVVH